MLNFYFYSDDQLELIEGIDYKPCPLIEITDNLQKKSTQYYKIVDSPQNADFIIYPYLLDQVAYSRKDNPLYLYEYLKKLPYIKNFEQKHVFFMELDHDKPFFNRAVCFRTNVNRQFPDINAVVIPFYVDDFDFHGDFSDFRYHTSFVGNINSHPIRKIISESLKSYTGINHLLDTTSYMYYYNDYETQKKRLELYKESLKKSVTIICPRGYGLSSLRFYESMSAGRIPVVIADGFVPPFENDIDYNSFCIFIPESKAAECPRLIHKWLTDTKPADIVAKCRASRYAFQTCLSSSVKEYFILYNLELVKQANYQLREELGEEIYRIFGLKKH